MNHALRCAELIAVPTRRVHKKRELADWSKNSNLVSACESVKLCLRIWNECDRLCSGIENNLRSRTKIKFARAFKDHKIILIKHKSFTGSCSDFKDGNTIFHLLK